MPDSTENPSPTSWPAPDPVQAAKVARKIDYTLRTFAPERWGQIDRFTKFFAASFPEAKPFERRAVSGAGNHFRKALVLRSLAIRIVPTLAIDRQQLNEKGYSPTDQAIELAAVVENVFTEIYSAVDCARQILTARYPGTPNSTRKTFASARSGTLDKVLPSELVSAIKEAIWYDPMRVLRDELTHFDIGSVYQDEATGKVTYVHTGLGTGERALIIEDIFGRMDADISAVNLFLGKLFYNLNTLLKDVPTIQLCGMHQGRALIREIRPEPVITFDSGSCRSLAWVEVDGKPTCPLLCSAYWKAKAEQIPTEASSPQP